MNPQCNVSTILVLCALVWSTSGQAAPPQKIRACEYLDEGAISEAIGKKVSKATYSGDTQAFDGFVLHTCDWVVPGSPNGKVILIIREAPTRTLNDQGIKEMKAAPRKPGLQTLHFSGLGDFAEYAYWDTEPRAGITVMKGTRNLHIAVSDAGRFGAIHKQAFASLAQKALAKF